MKKNHKITLISSVSLSSVSLNTKKLYRFISEFKIERVILLVLKLKVKKVSGIKTELEKFKIKTDIISIEKADWRNYFMITSNLVKKYNNAVINISLGSKEACYGLLSCAFAHGIKVYSIKRGNIVRFPVLPYPYAQVIGEKRMAMLKALKKKPLSIEEISRKFNLSAPLITYYLNGSKDREGLVKLELVKVKEDRVMLTDLGRLVIQ